MQKNRHRRAISTEILKPSVKPVISGQEKVIHTTLNTEPIRCIDQMTCSYSFDEGPNEHEKQLFSKFLEARHLDWMMIFSSMHQNQTDLVPFVRIGEDAQTVYNNRIISHYIGIWLDTMSYHQEATRERVMSNVSLYFNSAPNVIEIAGLMYDHLLQGYLPEKLQLRCLLELCRRGWEYFSYLICRLIQIIRDINFIPPSQLYQKLQQAIQDLQIRET